MAESNGKDFIMGTILGAAVGASLALLFAPKSGKEFRGDINQGAYQVKERATEWKDIAQAKGQEWKDVAVEKGSELKQKTQEISSNVQTKIQDMRDKNSVDSGSENSEKPEAVEVNTDQAEA